MDLCNLAHMVLLVSYYETVWLHHINAPFKIIVQKHCLDIHFPYLINGMCYNGNEYYDGFDSKPSFLLQPFPKSLILYVSTFPSTLLFLFWTYSHPISFITLSAFIRSQTLLEYVDSNSTFIALCHRIASSPLIASS